MTVTTKKAVKTAVHVCTLKIPFHFNGAFKEFCAKEVGWKPSYSDGDRWQVYATAGDQAAIEKIKQFARLHALKYGKSWYAHGNTPGMLAEININPEALDAVLAASESQPPSIQNELLARANGEILSMREQLAQAAEKIKRLESRLQFANDSLNGCDQNMTVAAWRASFAAARNA